MKILILTSYTPSLFLFRAEMMQEFLNLNCQVVAVGNEAEEIWKPRFAEKGIEYRQVYIQRNGINPFKDLGTLRGLKKIIREEQPDKVFAYLAKAIVYGGMAIKKKNIDFYPLIAGIGSIFLGKGFKKGIIRKILTTEYKIALKKAKKVFFQNDDDIQEFLRYKLVRKDQVVKINGSGVNLDKFKEQPLPKETVFLCVSRLIKDKGVFEYLEAAKIVKSVYPKTRFLLVGPFDTNPSALKEEELLPYIENGTIEYFGEQKDVRPYLEQCSVFVLPSYREGTPKSILEAMACGKAIITTDAPGCRETVIDGENGFLVPIKDVPGLVTKAQLLIENPQRIPLMAKKGRSLVVEKFDVNKVNKVIVDTMEIN